MSPCYLILLTYQVPMERLQQTVPAHRAYLGQYYASGEILLSGRLHSQQGGLILMKASHEQKIHDLIAQDPFHQEGLATYEIIPFEVRLHQPWLADWLEVTESSS